MEKTMIGERTILNQIAVTDDKTIQVRFGLLLSENGVIVSQKWHRTAFPMNHDVKAQIAAVNAHLEKIGMPMVSDEDSSTIEKACAIAWEQQE